MPSETPSTVAVETQRLVVARRHRPPGRGEVAAAHIEGGDTTALLALITELRTRASTKLGKPAEVVVLLRGGPDGFLLPPSVTIARRRCYVLEPTSIR